ncbi:MAG TPA: 2-hydroxychromene-2-carboxylate isomerase [Kofleriaceae bacterium]|nr:2-hydroxychromene-2-carboxylate isomerase [Kofleriaceae bacterium]
MIRIYFDYISPYSYLAWVKLAEIAARHGRAIEPVPILFAAILDARGARGPAEEPARRAYLIKDLLRRAHDLGVPIELPPAHPFNPLLPLRVTSLPMPPEIRHALVDHLFAATWAGGGGITDRKLVARIAHEVGLPEGAIAEAETPENKARLKAATDEAIAAGAFGVPTMIADGEMFFGSDSLPHLDRFLAGGDPVDQDLVERWLTLPAASQRPQATRT